MNPSSHTRPTLLPGLRHSERILVSTDHTVPQVADWPGFSDMPSVLATAVMVGFMEQIGIQGKALTFRVRCRDEAGLIGEGLHRRAIIDLQRFVQRLAAKNAGDVST